MLAPIFDASTTTAVRAERAFMALLEGGCSVPIAAHCHRDDIHGMWVFRGWVGRPDGTECLTERAEGKDPVVIAEAMATSFIERGARDLIRSARNA